MKLFITFKLKGFSTWGEWYTIFLCCLFHLPTTTRGPRRKTTGLISASPESQPSSSGAKTQLTDFSQISQNPPHTLPVHDVIYIARSHFSIWDFYFDFYEWHILPVRAWTPVLMLHLTNPCSKRKVLSLTKPKGKIYKTKSLGHYITFALL